MSTIDAHVHLYPPEINADPAGWARRAGEKHWATLSTRVRKNGTPVQDFPSVEKLIEEMDAAGVERAALLGWYWEQPESAERQNTFYLECLDRFPDRLYAFASIHPRAGSRNVLDEMWRCQDGGMCGLGELSPHAQGFPKHDKVFLQALTLCAALRWPVNLHASDARTPDYAGKVKTPFIDFLALAEEFPAVNFILAHWGGVDAYAAGACGPNIYFDTAASPLTYGPEVWRSFQSLVAADRIIFGSDYPLNLYPKNAAKPRMADFIGEARAEGATEEIMGKNFLRLVPGSRR